MSSLRALSVFAACAQLHYAADAWPATQVVRFGGTVGLAYSPDRFSASVGDSVRWEGSFSTHPLSSTTIPAGAQTWHVASGSSFTYVIAEPGAYGYRCDLHAAGGMVGSFSAAVQAVSHGRSAWFGAADGLELTVSSPQRDIVTTVCSQTPRKVTLYLVDALGNRMMTIADEVMSSGAFRAEVDASRFSPGVHFVVLTDQGSQGALVVRFVR